MKTASLKATNLDSYFRSLDLNEECSLIKGMEDLKMNKEDVHDYVDNEYLSLNRTLYAMKEVLKGKFMEMLEWFYLGYLGQEVLGELPPVVRVIRIDLLGLYKFVDAMGGYMNVTFNDKWYQVAKILGLAYEHHETVKEVYKEYIGIGKVYYEEANRSRHGEPRDMAVNYRGTAGRERPQKVEEVVTYNSSKLQPSSKQIGESSGLSRKERRARCYICRKKGHVYWKCTSKERSTKIQEPNMPSHVMIEVQERINNPERVHVTTDYIVVGSDKGNWNNIWYVSSAYKRHMSPMKHLFKRMIQRFRVEGTEEKKRKFLISYRVGEAFVETNEGRITISNVLFTPEVTLNILSIDQLEEQGYMIDKLVYGNWEVLKGKFVEMLEWFYIGYLGQEVLGELSPVIGVIRIDLLGLYKFVDAMGGYMNVTFNDKWYQVAKILGLAYEHHETVKEVYKEYIGMVKVYYEEAKRSRHGEPRDVAVNCRGTAGRERPQVSAKIKAEVEEMPDETPRKRSRTEREDVNMKDVNNA
nr:ARID DNA-binding domain-containing protein [Tanacetum cinerariifolium]